MLEFDEAMINEQFGRKLDIMPSSVASRSVDFPMIGRLALIRLPGLALLQLLGHEEAEIGMKVILIKQFLEQRSKDVIEITSRRVVDDMTEGIITQHNSINCPLIVGPLMFKYTEGLFVIDTDKGISTVGTEVVVLTLVEWNSLGG